MRMQEHMRKKTVVSTEEGALATACLPWPTKTITSALTLKNKQPRFETHLFYACSNWTQRLSQRIWGNRLKTPSLSSPPAPSLISQAVEHSIIVFIQSCP